MWQRQPPAPSDIDRKTSIAGKREWDLLAGGYNGLAKFHQPEREHRYDVLLQGEGVKTCGYDEGVRVVFGHCLGQVRAGRHNQSASRSHWRDARCGELGRRERCDPPSLKGEPPEGRRGMQREVPSSEGGRRAMIADKMEISEHFQGRGYGERVRLSGGEEED